MTTTTLVPGEVAMMPVVEYMQRLEASLDIDYVQEGWLFSAIIMEKVLDGNMGAIIESILKYGFNVPIGIAVLDSGGIMQMNGHHRIVASILLGLDKVPVFVQEYPDECDFESTSGDANDFFTQGGDSLSREGQDAYGEWLPLLESVYNDVRNDWESDNRSSE